MTEKLYYSEPQTYEWTTEVTSILERNNKIYVTLAKTAFYPTGGGQPHDTGYIDTLKVLDVVEEEEEIFHVLESKPDTKTVHCRIDKKRRIDHTQHHTGQHLLSAVCIELYDVHTTSFHLGEETVTIDLDIPELTYEQLQTIEAKVNQYIYEGKQVKTYLVKENELSQIPLRKIPDVKGEIRIVEIEGIDYSACCGTHVLQTSEIGILKLVKTEKQRGNTRLHFLCGFRAIHDYHVKHDILTEITKYLSTSKEDLIERIKKMENEKKEVGRKLDEALNENAIFLAESLLQKNKGPFIVQAFAEKTLQELQILSRKLMDTENKLVVLASIPDKKCLLQHNGEVDFHCGQFVKEHISSFHGKGGGAKNNAQVIFANESDMNAFLEHVKHNSIIKSR
ncbi:alanine--tRNA ligase-related protein [Bacillus sp. FJAT-49736]|uniref:alanyl-tRNA editing protein n=1 Tax=Bacillus sp. FJAT-49736 TaxID=2833582 RepID=UPI001BC9B3C5|nr:alanine--tRNA ligase-related protein [Bacillus sp. FJAT-49736]MBS4173091.1 alanyl-tRNA editing protein [Bacillus sp. FJAT-49736]